MNLTKILNELRGELLLVEQAIIALGQSAERSARLLCKICWRNGNPLAHAHGRFEKCRDFRDHDGGIRGPATKRTRSRVVLLHSRRSEAHYGVQGGRGVHDLYRMAGSIRSQTRDTIRSRHNLSAGTRHLPKGGKLVWCLSRYPTSGGSSGYAVSGTPLANLEYMMNRISRQMKEG